MNDKGKYTLINYYCTKLITTYCKYKLCANKYKYSLSYKKCTASYGYVDDKTNYPDTYPDTCVESTPSCSTNNDLGNVKVTCVQE